MKKAFLFSLVFVLLLAATAAIASEFKQIAEFEIPEANQGIGVDENYFYAINNQIIAKYDKRTGKLEAKWQGSKDGPIIHLDSAGRHRRQNLLRAFELAGMADDQLHRNLGCKDDGAHRQPQLRNTLGIGDMDRSA